MGGDVVSIRTTLLRGILNKFLENKLKKALAAKIALDIPSLDIRHEEDGSFSLEAHVCAVVPEGEFNKLVTKIGL